MKTLKQYFRLSSIIVLTLLELTSAQLESPYSSYSTIESQNLSNVSEIASFLKEFDREAADMCNRVANSEWRYSTNATDFNRRKMREQQSLATKFECVSWKKAHAYDVSKIFDTNIRRQLRRISSQGRCGLDDDKHREITRLITTMKDHYNGIRLCSFQGQNATMFASTRASFVHGYTGYCDMRLDPNLIRIMEHSRNEPELKYTFTAWRDRVGPPIKNSFMRYVQLANAAAQKQGFHDAGEQMRSQYEDPDFYFTVQELWSNVQPLYRKLVTFTRKGLVFYYGEEVLRPDGPIPAHLLGNMWAQNWKPILDIVRPGPSQIPDITGEIQRQNYTPMKMFQIAEEFFTSMGMPPMSPEFWRNSILQKPSNSLTQCTASAWDFCNGIDYRIKQCTQVTLEDFINSHQEMAHIHYYMQYSNNNKPFVYREGPNPAFHGAVANAVALCVGNPVHLQRIGLLNLPISLTNGNTAINIEYLLGLALDKLPFMAYSVALEKWRWHVFEKGPENMNSRYWELKLRYQGIIPPTSRTNDHFDAAAKYHVLSDQDYIKYFVATILQFQIYAELCEVAGQTTPLHTCDFSKSREAGKLLASVMETGASISSFELLKMMSRGKINRMSAKPLLEFFRPLEAWLDLQNFNESVIGWNSNIEDVALFQSFNSGTANYHINFIVLTILCTCTCFFKLKNF